MTADDFPVMPERCGSCAYREGTNASKSPLTQLKAKLCLETGERFLCHEDPNQIGLCRGWVDALTARYERKIPFEEIEWKRELLLFLTDLITRYENSIKAGTPFDYVAELQKMYGNAMKTPPSSEDHAPPPLP